MRSRVKYILALGAVLALAWAAVTVQLGGRTAYGHLRAGGAGRLWAEVQGHAKGLWASAFPPAKKTPAAPTKKAKAPSPQRQAKRPAAAPEPETPAVQRDPKAETRVALLDSAAKKIAPKAKPDAPPAKKTRIDERISPDAKKALDALVTSRKAPDR